MLAEQKMEFEINIPDQPRGITYNDVSRSTEPAWRSSRPTNPGNPVDWTQTRPPVDWQGFRPGAWDDPLKVKFEEEMRKTAERAKRAEQERQEKARQEQEERTAREGHRYYEQTDVPYFEDILRNIFRDMPPNYTDTRGFRARNPFTYGPTKKPEKERRNLRCKTCKNEVSTVFIGAPELFECNDCQWTAYTKAKPATDFDNM